jgi:hypothetical protein
MLALHDARIPTKRNASFLERVKCKIKFLNLFSSLVGAQTGQIILGREYDANANQQLRVNMIKRGALVRAGNL